MINKSSNNCQCGNYDAGEQGTKFIRPRARTFMVRAPPLPTAPLSTSRLHYPLVYFYERMQGCMCARSFAAPRHAAVCICERESEYDRVLSPPSLPPSLPPSFRDDDSGDSNSCVSPPALVSKSEKTSVGEK